jgi:hypothetical protein
MGYRVAEDASAGASSAGSMGGGFGNGFANGGPGSIMRRKPRKKKIGEAESGVVHCSQCGKGFSSAGLKPPHHTGFSHCKDHKGMRIVAEGLTLEPTDKEEPTQQKSISNINTQRAVKQGATPKVDTKIDEQEPKFTGYWKGKDKGRPGKKMVGDA